MAFSADTLRSGSILKHISSYDEFIVKSSKIINQSPDRTYAIMYVDIVNFHSINSFYGFSEGDRMLAEFAKFLTFSNNSLKCGRVFSDKFLRLTNVENKSNIREEIKYYEHSFKVFLEEQNIYHPNCKLNIACGLCFIENGNIPEAVDCANIALKESKKLNQTNIVLFDEAMRSRVFKQQKLEHTIQKALRNEEFYYELQPKINMSTGKIIGAEALARLKDENGNVIYPSEFIPIMEKNGSITELDFLICRKICKKLSGLIDTPLPVVPVSINLSRQHSKNPGTAKRIQEIAKEYGIPPYLLEFEITETILLEDFQSTKQLISDLRFCGYKVSIDDFGSGYAGMNTWQELSFDVLKLDKKFLAEDKSSRIRNSVLIPRIMEIANDLQTTVICEGVETIDHCRFLSELGCHVVQGYYFSKPLSDEEMTKLLQESNGYISLPNLHNLNSGKQNTLSKNRIREITNTIFDILPGGMIGYDPDSMTPLFVTEGIVKLTGFDKEEFFDGTGKWISILFPASKKIKDKTFRDLKLTGYAQVEYTILRKSGVPAYIHMYGGKTNSPEWGNYVLCCFFDETASLNERLAVKNENLNLKRFQREIFDAVSCGIIQCRFPDSNFNTLDCVSINKKALEITGYTQEEFFEYFTGNILSLFHLGDTDLLKGHLSKLQNIGDEAPFEFRIYKKSGELTEIKGTAKVIYSQSGEQMIIFVFSENEAYQEPVRSGNHFRIKSKSHKSWQVMTLSDYSAMDKNKSRIKANRILRTLSLILTFLLFIGGITFLYADYHKKVSHQIDTLLHGDINPFVTVTRAEAYNFFMKTSGQTLLTGAFLILFTALLSIIIITLFSKQQKKLLESQQRYAILSRFPDTVLFDYSIASDTVKFTPNATSLFKVRSLRLRGFLKTMDSDKIIIQGADELKRVLKGESKTNRGNIEIKLIRPGGEHFWALVQYQYIYRGKTLNSVFGKIMDIDLQKKRENQLLEKSITDGMTGLLNKTSFESTVSNLLKQKRPGFLLMFDVDNFKDINDKYGHPIGDKILTEIGNILTLVFDTNAYIGRIGGDEFTVYLDNTTSLDYVRSKASQTLNIINEISKKYSLTTTISIGIVPVTKDDKSYSEIFRNADNAMYVAKKRGKNQYYYSDEKKLVTNG